MSFVFTLASLGVVFAISMLVVSRIQDRKRRAAPRITQSELDGYWGAIHAARLPFAKIYVGADHPLLAAQSRIGGLPFAEMGRETWPSGGVDGLPMQFLAQINFADMAGLDGFPAKGLLQLFGAVDERGALDNLEDPSARVLRWFPDPQGDRTLPLPDSLATAKHSVFSKRALHEGLTLGFELGQAPGNPSNDEFLDLAPDDRSRMGETEAVQAQLGRAFADKEAHILEGYGAHWVGGHPSFTQNDVRIDPETRKLDRVVLHLGFDDNVCLGDAGELNLLISKEDLAGQDFSNAVCFWDCY